MIRYYRTSRNDCFITDGRAWYSWQFPAGPGLVRLKDASLVPHKLIELDPESSGLILPAFEQGIKSLDEWDGDIMGKESGHGTRIDRIHVECEYPDVFSILDPGRPDESTLDRYTLYRSGYILYEHFEKRDRELTESEEYQIRYDDIMTLFDDLEKLQPQIDCHSSIVDDQAGGIRLMYSNGISVFFDRGCRAGDDNVYYETISRIEKLISSKCRLS